MQDSTKGTRFEDALPMTEKPEPSSAKFEVTKSQQVRGDLLTDAQRAFAKLLGRLLAEQWQGEQQNQRATGFPMVADALRPSNGAAGRRE
jgi:hypothetical protein